MQWSLWRTFYIVCFRERENKDFLVFEGVDVL